MATYTITATETTLINVGGQGVSPDGLALQFTVTGTNSAVLKRLTTPPGAAQSFTNVAYLNASLASQSAGTAVTASGMAYISAADAAQDIYVTNTYTSGSVVITSSPWSIGGSGGGGGGETPAADVTPGTFGANTGATGDYTFPDDVVVSDDADVVGDLTAGTIASDAGVSGTSVTFTTLTASTTALATPSALAATASNQFASTVSGATLMGFGTTHDVTLKNRAGTSVLGVTANTSDVTAAGALAVTGVLSNAATSASLAQNAATAAVNVGTGTGSGASELKVRSAAGQSAAVTVASASAARWAFLKGTVAESGANAGSELQIRAFDDAGTGIDSPITITRATGGSIALVRPMTSTSSVLLSGPTLGLGYTTGAGGAQTQLTDKATTVVSNTITTAITMNAAELAAATIVAFTFTNSTIAATDTVICTHQSAGTSGAYTVNAFPGAGSAVISVRNNTGGALSEAIVLRVTVVKSVSA